jgi:hypothetical protein
VELLEVRSLLAVASESFVVPAQVATLLAPRQLTGGAGQKIFETLLQSYRSQLESGPLAGLTQGTVVAIAAFQKAHPDFATTSVENQVKGSFGTDMTAMSVAAGNAGRQFVAQVTSLTNSFESAVNGQLKRVSPRFALMLDEQGDALVATETQWYQRYAAAAYTRDNGSDPTSRPYYYLKNSTETITKLVDSRPLWPTNTPLLKIYQRADTFVHDAKSDVVDMLGFYNSATNGYDSTQVQTAFNISSQAIGTFPTAQFFQTVSTTPVTPQAFVANVVALADAETATFRADIDATGASKLCVTHLIQRKVDQATAALTSSFNAILQNGGDPKVQATAALTTFQSQIMVGTGLFGLQGPLRSLFHAPVNPFPDAKYSNVYTYTNAVVTKRTLPTAQTYFRYESDPKPGAPIPPPPLDPSQPSSINDYLNNYLKVTKENNYFGSFLSTDAYTTSADAIRGVALDQSWFHPSLATHRLTVQVAAGTVVYDGTAAPILQGLLAPERVPSLYPGMGEQTVVLARTTNYNGDTPLPPGNRQAEPA